MPLANILKIVFGIVLFVLIILFRFSKLKNLNEYLGVFISGILWPVSIFFLVAPIFTNAYFVGGAIGASLYFSMLLDNRTYSSKKDDRPDGWFVALSLVGGIFGIVIAFFFGSFMFNYITPDSITWVVNSDLWKIFLWIATPIAIVLFWLDTKLEEEKLGTAAIYLILLPSTLILSAGAQMIGTLLTLLDKTAIISGLISFKSAFFGIIIFTLSTALAWSSRYIDHRHVGRLVMEVSHSILYVVAAGMITYPIF